MSSRTNLNIYININSYRKYTRGNESPISILLYECFKLLPPSVRVSNCRQYINLLNIALNMLNYEVHTLTTPL